MIIPVVLVTLPFESVSREIVSEKLTISNVPPFIVTLLEFGSTLLVADLRVPELITMPPVKLLEALPKSTLLVPLSVMPPDPLMMFEKVRTLLRLMSRVPLFVILPARLPAEPASSKVPAEMVVPPL